VTRPAQEARDRAAREQQEKEQRERERVAREKAAGVWTDPATGLMWTKQDSGSGVSWDQAKAYCSNLRLGGFSDWRLPTIDELQGIYDPSIDVPGHWSVRTLHALCVRRSGQ
jgi:formylglycine-generating enzyme required for sulfatase activity